MCGSGWMQAYSVHIRHVEKKADVMDLSEVPEIQKDFEELGEIGISGFVLAVNVRWNGPEFLHSTYPEEWRTLYEESHFFMFDPIYYWSLMKTGVRRWSEIRFPDPKIVSNKAARHGLVFGAIVCRKFNGEKSFLSAARPDRELTDAEMRRMEELLINWVSISRDLAPTEVVQRS